MAPEGRNMAKEHGHFRSRPESLLQRLFCWRFRAASGWMGHLGTVMTIPCYFEYEELRLRIVSVDVIWAGIFLGLWPRIYTVQVGWQTSHWFIVSLSFLAHGTKGSPYTTCIFGTPVHWGKSTFLWRGYTVWLIFEKVELDQNSAQVNSLNRSLSARRVCIAARAQMSRCRSCCHIYSRGWRVYDK